MTDVVLEKQVFEHDPAFLKRIKRRCGWCNKAIIDISHNRKYCNNKCFKEYSLERKKRYYQENLDYFKKHNKKYQEENEEKIKVLKKEHYKKHIKKILKKAKKYRKENKDKINKYQKERYLKDVNKFRQKTKDWRERKRRQGLLKEFDDKHNSNRTPYFNKKVKEYRKNPILRKRMVARNKAEYKIKIKPKDMCKSCGSKKDLERHHQDYDKPLEIEILCRDCHRKLHRRKNGLRN